MEQAELKMNGVDCKDTVINGCLENGVGAVKNADYTNNISEIGSIHDAELKAENGFVAMHEKTEFCSMGQSGDGPTEGFEYKATRSYAANYSPTSDNLRRRPLSTYEKREQESTITSAKILKPNGKISRKNKCVLALFVLLNVTGIYLICNESDDVKNLLSGIKYDFFTSHGKKGDEVKNTSLKHKSTHTNKSSKLKESVIKDSSSRVEKGEADVPRRKVEQNDNKDAPPIEKKDVLKHSTPEVKEKEIKNTHPEIKKVPDKIQNTMPKAK